MLQVDPVLFDIDFVRANEDPADVDIAKGEVQEFQSIVLDDGLLEATLSGATVTDQDVNSSLVDPSGQSGAGEFSGSESVGPKESAESEVYCTDIPTPDEYTCEQQKGWGKCTADSMLEGNFCARTCGRC